MKLALWTGRLTIFKVTTEFYHRKALHNKKKLSKLVISNISVKNPSKVIFNF